MATVLDIELDDGTVKRVKVLIADRIAVGNAGKGSTDDIQRNPMEYQARLAYAAMARMGLADGTFEQWLPTIADMDMVDSTANPTEMGTGLIP